MLNKRFIYGLATAVLLLMAACGGGAPAEETVETVTLDVIGDDSFNFEPANYTVPAGAEVTVNFENVGTLEHSWVLVSERVEPTEATAEDALAGASSGTIAGGESTTFTFAAPPAGEYTVVCTIPGHAAGGMVTSLTSTP